MSDDTLKKVKDEINKDEVLHKLEEEYQVEDLLTYNEFDVMDKMAKNPYLYEQFRLLYIKELGNLERVEMMLEERIGEVFDDYLQNSQLNITKAEIKSFYVPNDKKVKRLRRILARQKIRVGYFDAVFKAFDKQSWQMKLFIQKMVE